MGGAISRASKQAGPVAQRLKPEIQQHANSSARHLNPIHVKDEVLVTRATQIMQDVDVTPPMPIKAAGPLPVSKNVEQYEDPEMPGRITATAWAELIVRHRKDPDNESAEKLAKEYHLEPSAVKSVLSQVTVPVVMERPGSKDKIGQWNEPNPDMKVPYVYFNDMFKSRKKQPNQKP